MNKTYNDTLILGNNNKTDKSSIIPADTSRGCNNNCIECYACRLSKISIKDFNIPILVKKIKGKIDKNKTYRFGTSGDPAYNWSHTEALLKQYPFNKNKCFYITKLLDIQGYRGYIKNMQVSIDTVNKEHFFTTLRNIKALLDKHSDIKIVMRIRSMSTFNKNINKLQDIAVKFANHYNIKVLETRIRFIKKNESITKYQLNTNDYSYRKSYLRPNKGTSFIKGNKHFTCDKKELGCKKCSLCSNLWNK